MLGEILVELNTAKQSQVDAALIMQEELRNYGMLGEIMVKFDWIKQEDLDEALAIQKKRMNLQYMIQN